MFNHIFNHQAKTVTFAAGVLGAASIVSGFLGLLRDRLLASHFGAGQDLDIYFAAFRIPDFVYGILIAGGIISVFLPVFSEHFGKSREKGWHLANVTFNCFLVLLILICLVLIIFIPFLIRFIAPGFDQEAQALTVSMSRIMLLSPIFFVLSSIFSGMLHYFNRFLAYSLAPIFYNLGIIFGILFLVPIFGIFGLAYGVILGAFLHLAVQIPAAKLSGYCYRPVLNFSYPGLKKIFKLMLPRTIGAAASHINLIIITAIASTLVSGSIAIFNFSNNLQRFPINLIGLSFGAAVFPALAKSWAANREKEFLEHFSLILRQILFLIIPVALLVFLLRAQLVRVILGAGQFGWLETRLTAASLGLFSLGIFAASLAPLFVRAFFAFQDTKTPVAVGVVSVGLNIGLAFLFVFLLGFGNFFRGFFVDFLKLEGIENIKVIGLPLAFSLAALIQLLLLFVFFFRKIGNFRIKEIWDSLKKILIAGVFLVGVSYLIRQSTAGFVDMQTFLGVFSQALLAGLGGIAVYSFVAWLLKSPEIKTLKSSISGQFKK